MKTIAKNVLIFIAIASSCFVLSSVFFLFIYSSKCFDAGYLKVSRLLKLQNNLRILFTSVLGMSAFLLLLGFSMLMWFIVRKLNHISGTSEKSNNLLLTFKPPRTYEIEKLSSKLSELYIKEARNKGKSNYFLTREIRKIESKIEKLKDMDSRTLMD